MDDRTVAVEFGRLMRSVEVLTEQLETTNETMQRLAKRLSDIETRYTTGKGFVYGVCIGIGFAVKGLWDTVTTFIGAR